MCHCASCPRGAVDRSSGTKGFGQGHCRCRPQHDRGWGAAWGGGPGVIVLVAASRIPAGWRKLSPGEEQHERGTALLQAWRWGRWTGGHECRWLPGGSCRGVVTPPRPAGSLQRPAAGWKEHHSFLRTALCLDAIPGAFLVFPQN